MATDSGGTVDAVVDAITGLAVAGFVLGLGVTVWRGEPTALGALLLAGLAALAIAGWVFVRHNRPYLAAATACLVLLNAAWNPVLWLLIVPVSAVLVAGAIAVAARRSGGETVAV